MKYIVDLDDTLVSSTQLNNDAYNYALEKFGYNRIVTDKRITRELLKGYNNIENIISQKQRYFSSAWLPYRILINRQLLQKLYENGKYNCFLWTKADKDRANKILELCNLKRYFCDVIFDKKEDFLKSTKKIKQRIKDNKFVIFENNFEFFKGQNVKVVDTIENQFFNVKGYLIL